MATATASSSGDANSTIAGRGPDTPASGASTVRAMSRASPSSAARIRCPNSAISRVVRYPEARVKVRPSTEMCRSSRSSGSP